MPERFHEELEELKEAVVAMGRLAEEMLKDSVVALKDQDVKLADDIIKRTEDLEELDYNIEEEALRLITLHQPMASDMRTIACILKMITYLTRIGRYGKDIAKITKITADKPHVAKLVEVPHMAEIVEGMIDDVLCTFTECDFEKCDLSRLPTFRKRDDEVDALMDSIIRQCLTYMMEDPKTITMCTRYIMVARHLERSADHACKIAEKLHYMETGERVTID